MKSLIKTWKSCLIGLLLSGSPVLWAQQAVTGCITDASDGTPVAGASVIIANTTVGTASDMSGNYSLKVPGKGIFEIVVSHVGYQPVFHKIDKPQDAHLCNITLETAELEEITVRAAKTYNQRDVDIFWRTILGERPSRNGIQALNQEDVYFYKSDNVLKASCKAPIEIVNHQTGYNIRYILQHFEYDYRSKEYILKGKPHFEELTPQDSRQNDRWEKKRQDVYAVSFNHFLRALFQGKIHEEGYLLVDRDDFMKRDKTTPAVLTDILQTGQDAIQLTIEHPLLLICYGMPVTKPGRVDIRRDIRTKGTAYPVLELPAQQILIYPDGTYQGDLKMIAYRNSIFGLSAELPVEYGATFSSLEYSKKSVAAEIDEEREADPGYILEENIANQLNVYPQEKIHLHTDRNMYIAGEKIWFKAYIVDAFTHLSPTYSQYVYAELIDAADSLVNRVMVTSDENGLFHGHILLSGKIPAGDYTLRAYTRYMENLGDDYYFKKNIRIGAVREGSRGNRGSRGSGEEDYDVSFFPEGGNAVEDVVCRVAFKALNRQGASTVISGEIVDSEGTSIVDVSTVFAGMGSFAYMPVQGVTYYLNCKNSAGQAKRFKLPSATKSLSLGTGFRNGQFFIQVKKSPGVAESPLYLLVHCKGEVCYFAPWNHRSEYISIPKEHLPAGVIQILLLDNEMNPLSERLVFNKNGLSEYLEFHTDKASYGKRENVKVSLSTPSLLGRAGERLLSGTAGVGLSHFSVAVTDDKDMAVDSLNTITSNLLLSSELRGYIESPGYFLQDHADAEYALDHLMMTHGWRRYDFPEAMKENYSLPAAGYESEKEITGLVRSGLFDRPAANGEVVVFSSDGLYDETVTDTGGRFRFGLHYPDSVSFFVQAKNQKGGESVDLIINTEQFPALKYAPVSLSLLPAAPAQENILIDFISKAGQRAQYDEDMKVFDLEEVVVTANRIEKRDIERLKFPFNRFSNVTIYKEAFDRSGVTDLIELIYRETPGAQVIYVGGIKQLFLRPRGTITGLHPPLIVINGIPLSWQPGDPITPLDEINIYEVESIDVFQGTGAAVFGMQGGNGVISITTKGASSNTKEKEIKTNSITVTPLGYQKPVEFYAPRYDTPASRYSGIPDYRTTIYWKPDLVVSDEGQASFEFYTADFSTIYSVVIEGLTSDGKIVRQVEKIVVRDDTTLP